MSHVLVRHVLQSSRHMAIRGIFKLLEFDFVSEF